MCLGDRKAPRAKFIHRKPVSSVTAGERKVPKCAKVTVAARRIHVRVAENLIDCSITYPAVGDGGRFSLLLMWFLLGLIFVLSVKSFLFRCEGTFIETVIFRCVRVQFQ